jgi:hypothetical protein
MLLRFEWSVLSLSRLEKLETLKLVVLIKTSSSTGVCAERAAHNELSSDGSKLSSKD